VANPRVERRLRDLESKLDRLLKELEGLKGEKKDKANENDDDKTSRSPRPADSVQDTTVSSIGV
jgi:hypothetical protein